MKLLFVNFSVYLQRFMLLDKCRKVQRGIPPQGAGVVVGGGLSTLQNWFLLTKELLANYV